MIERAKGSHFHFGAISSQAQKMNHLMNTRLVLAQSLDLVFEQIHEETELGIEQGKCVLW